MHVVQGPIPPGSADSLVIAQLLNREGSIEREDVLVRERCERKGIRIIVPAVREPRHSLVQRFGMGFVLP